MDPSKLTDFPIRHQSPSCIIIYPMKKNQIQPDPQSEPRGIVRQLALPLTILLLMFAASRYAVDYWPAIETHIAQMGPSGYAVFSLVFIFLTALCFPVSLMGISAGVLFGPWIGFALVAFSDLAGGLLMFVLGRTFLRARIQSLLTSRPKLAAVDRMAGRKAYRLNILTRLSPLNYGLACYTLAAGRTTLKAYTVGLLGVLPSIAFQVGFGVAAQHSGKALLSGENGNTIQMVGLGVGLLFFLVLSTIVGKMVKDAMNEEDASFEAKIDNGQEME